MHEYESGWLMASYDLVGIGNALVDVLVTVEDSFLDENNLPKGSMNLVDADQSDALYAKVSAGVEVSGGSCGNTMAGFSALGANDGTTGAYIGKVRNDDLGKVFMSDMASMGVHCGFQPTVEGSGTGRCVVMVSEDAQRTMATYLGAATDLGPEDIDATTIEASKILYMEGYLFDRDAAKQAFIKAADLSHGADRKVSLSLSDPFCVGRHRDAFLALVRDHIDILFANEEEIMSLYQVDDFDAALQHVRGHCEIACLTRSSKGSVILSGDEVHVIDAMPVGDKLTDTTGAGDQYAAGFLYGYAKGFDLAVSGKIASIAAAEVVSHYGARPEADIRQMVSAELGL